MQAEHAFTMWLPPEGQSQPLVFDSPHSSCQFPEHPALNANPNQLKTGWDAFVEELWMPAVDMGASLIAANFSRMYIDPNRAATDIDDALLAEPWPLNAQPTPYSERGMGLIRRFALPDIPMYNRSLSVADIQSRIKNYYTPYHEKLAKRLQHLRKQFGSVWHIDCHSMKSKGNAMNIDAGTARPDIVVSDAKGTSSSPEFTEVVADAFKRLGFHTSVNHPYQGGHIVRQYGQPEQGVNSIQIELNRRLYMHEAAFEKSERFNELQHKLSQVSEVILEYIKENT